MDESIPVEPIARAAHHRDGIGSPSHGRNNAPPQPVHADMQQKVGRAEDACIHAVHGRGLSGVPEIRVGVRRATFGEDVPVQIQTVA